MKRYYSLYKQEKEADVYIYGDITAYPDEENTSSYSLAMQLQELEDVDLINVYISSYGGEVNEGIAIYNALKRHKARIRTYTDDFACSIASVIFAAGDERIMNDTALLMIHNAWTNTVGDSNELRKKAADLEKVNQLSINAYMKVVNISENELKELLNNETWLTAKSAYHIRLATQINEDKNKEAHVKSLKKNVVSRVSNSTVSKKRVKSQKPNKFIEMLVNTLSNKV